MCMCVSFILTLAFGKRQIIQIESFPIHLHSCAYQYTDRSRMYSLRLFIFRLHVNAAKRNWFNLTIEMAHPLVVIINRTSYFF